MIKKFNQKLLEAQKSISAITKSKDNPFFKSKYADINAYLSEVKPKLNEAGLVLIQPTVILDGKNVLETIIMDSESAEFIKSSLILPEIADVQKFGGVLTYVRRYEIQSLLGLEAEDDDGETANGRKGEKPKVGNKGVNAEVGEPFGESLTGLN